MVSKQMELQEMLSVAISTLLAIVIAHFAVFWVVRTMYPPVMVVTQSPQAPPPQVFTPPPSIPQPEAQQNATIPTYAPPLPVEAPREEGERRGPPPAESTSIRRDPGVAPPVPQ